MLHENHPDVTYEMANLVTSFAPPHTIAWKPGYRASDTGDLAYGGWTWSYDLRPLDQESTQVTLTYDWSAITTEARQVQNFPPFPPEHLSNSLAHLAALVTR